MAIAGLSDARFREILRETLSPSTTIRTPEYLRGRAQDLEKIDRAFNVGGRQVFIHGFRGVGKTSLAQTAAFLHQSSDADPIFVSCGEGAGFFQLIHDIVYQAMSQDPTVRERAFENQVGGNIGPISTSLRETVVRGEAPIPTSLNDALALINYVSRSHSRNPVVVVDEFDALQDNSDKRRFAEFIKQVGDRNIKIKFVFCGIGDSLDDLFVAHLSAFRHFAAINLPRLKINHSMEIISGAASALGVNVDFTTSARIARISDGFPHFVHLIAYELFWVMFEYDEEIESPLASMFEEAVNRALGSIEPQLKAPYERATRKYSNDYEEVLWAVADDHQLQRPSREIWESYRRVMSLRGRAPLTRQQFNTRINNLKKDRHGSILQGTRQGWYEYREKVLRGYARLRAQQIGIELGADHPLQERSL